MNRCHRNKAEKRNTFLVKIPHLWEILNSFWKMFHNFVLPSNSPFNSILKKSDKKIVYMKDPAKHRDILKITAYWKTPKICNQTVKQNGILILGIHFWRAFNNLSYCAPFPSNVCEVTSLLTCVFVMGSSKKGWACHCIRAFNNNTAAESSFEPSCSGILIPALLLSHTYVDRTKNSYSYPVT